MKLYKKENFFKQNYLFHRNLQFQKFINTSPSVLPGRGMRTKLICTPANLFPQPPHSGWGTPHSTHEPILIYINP